MTRHVSGATRLVLPVLLALATPLPAACPAAPPAAPPVSRIAFGSCLRQDRPQPIWDAILAARPELFILLGDNVYADTTEPGPLRAEYDRLAAQPGFGKLRDLATVLATWDDHDYGANDAGADLPGKDASRRVFLDFFGEPADSPRRARDGIYDARTFGPPGRRVQVILLDTRYNRSPLRAVPGLGGRYRPDPSPQATILGKTQWAWLEARLREPADLRLLVSSIQLLADEHPFEKWGNFPAERQRLLELLERGRAAGVLVLSGDRHHGEIGRLERPQAYPLLEVTSSSLNSSRRPEEEPNRYRLGDPLYADNFGLVSIDWEQEDPLVTLELRDVEGTARARHSVRLSQLAPRPR